MILTTIFTLGLLYLIESLILKQQPRWQRYVIALVLLASYGYVHGDDYDDEERVCRPIKLSPKQIESIQKEIGYYDIQGEWAVNRALEVTFKIHIPEEQTFTQVAIESLIVALAASDNKSRLVGLCLVSISEVIKKSLSSAKESQTYLRYAEFCYEMAEFYDRILELHAVGRTVTNCDMNDIEDWDISHHEDPIIRSDKTRPLRCGKQ